MSTSDTPRIPSYRPHKATGQARVTIQGKDYYLGRYGSPESRAKYRRLIAEYCKGAAPTAEPRTNSPRAGAPCSVAELCGEYLAWAKREYRTSDGDETGSVENVRQALRALFELFADTDAAEFGPKSLVRLREDLVKRGLARSTVNDRIAIVRRAFKWAVQEEKVAPGVYHGLQTVSGLRRDRGGARETEPVHPAPERAIEAALPFMPEPVQAMTRLQLLTGARPSEIALMRPVEIDRNGAVWVYRPATHKNRWRGQERMIYIGPKGQEVIRAFLRPGLQDKFLFSPTVAELRRRDRLRAARKTPLYPSHVRALERKRKAKPQRQPRDRYDVGTYRQAIARACRRANVAPWKPNQLRHNAATRLRAEFGLDVAKAVLGHTRVETTQIYAEADRNRAMQAIASVG